MGLLLSGTLLLSLGIFEIVYIDRSAKHILSQISLLAAAAEKADWPDVERELTRLEADWNRTSDKWTVFLHHSEIDMLSMSVARAGGFAKTRSRDLLLSEVVSMKTIVAHIPDLERVTLSNIF